MITPNDKQVDLVINRMSRDIYNALSAQTGMIHKNELYLIDDVNFDVFNKRIVNVNTPQSESDAVNLGYLEEKCITRSNISSFIDNSKIYSENKQDHWENSSTYINGKREVYSKDTSSWETQVKAGSVSQSVVGVDWRDGFGWHFTINGSFVDGMHYFNDSIPDTLEDTFTYNGEKTTLFATSWHKTDELVSKKDIYSKLSVIDNESTTKQIAQAIVNLNSILSSF